MCSLDFLDVELGVVVRVERVLVVRDDRRLGRRGGDDADGGPDPLQLERVELFMSLLHARIAEEVGYAPVKVRTGGVDGYGVSGAPRLAGKRI